MGPTVTTVEIAGGEVGDLVAEHFEEHRRGRRREVGRQADHAPIEMDPPQGSAEPPTPVDANALREVREAPPASALLEKALDARVGGCAGGRRHPRDASTPCRVVTAASIWK
jgi:hypothetical protein